MNFDGFTITNAGKKILLSELADNNFTNIEFCKLSFGSGRRAKPHETVQALAIPTVTISGNNFTYNINIDNNNNIILDALITDPALAARSITEIGIFVKTRADDTEILFAYQTSYYRSHIISNVQFRFFININLETDSNAKINISNNQEFVTLNELNQLLDNHNNTEDSHNNSINKTIFLEPFPCKLSYGFGNAVYPVWYNFEDNVLDITESKINTEPGEYNSVFTPKTGYRWSDGSRSPKYIPWYINKKPNLIMNENNIQYKSNADIWSEINTFTFFLKSNNDDYEFKKDEIVILNTPTHYIENSFDITLDGKITFKIEERQFPELHHIAVILFYFKENNLFYKSNVVALLIELIQKSEKLIYTD